MFAREIDGFCSTRPRAARSCSSERGRILGYRRADTGFARVCGGLAHAFCDELPPNPGAEPTKLEAAYWFNNAILGPAWDVDAEDAARADDAVVDTPVPFAASVVTEENGVAVDWRVVVVVVAVVLIASVPAGKVGAPARLTLLPARSFTPLRL